MTRLRAAIIGQGRSGRDIHSRHMRDLPDLFEIVAAVDPWKQRRERAAEELGCDVYRDHKPLLKRKDIDLVVNATPSHLHVPISLEFLKAGHNVLTEKPLALTVADVDRLSAAAKKSGALMAVYQQSRYAPYFRQVKKVIDSGLLGRIVQISIWFNGFSRRWDQQCLVDWHGGNLMNTGPHPLDQALRFLDLPTDQTPQVFCHMDRTHFFGDAEGHFKLVLRAPDKPLIEIEASSCCAYPMFMYHVYANHGGLKGTATDIEWKYYKPKEAPRRRNTTVPIHKEDGTPAYCGEQLTWHEEKWQVPDEQKDLFNTIGQSYYRMLHKHMTEGGPLEVTVPQVRQQIAIIEEAHRQNPHIWGRLSGARRSAKGR